MLDNEESNRCYLGQFIPVHYHHNMLMDKNRMQGFKSAIDYAVMPGAKVLEMGGGTGALSWFAAAKASIVYCVEFNPDLVAEARKLLAHNRNGHKVEVIHADAFEYLPPEPVDVVICEMIHAGMLREKQVEVIESFKRRYTARFGAALPILVPEAVVMAVQPLQQDYDFGGFHAPIIQFQQNDAIHSGTVELSAPVVYSILDFTAPTETLIVWEGTMRIERDGTLNAMRFLTKNILAIVATEGRTIDWLNNYMTVPLEHSHPVRSGDVLRVHISYCAGGSIPSLQAGIRIGVECVVDAAASNETASA